MLWEAGAGHAGAVHRGKDHIRFTPLPKGNGDQETIRLPKGPFAWTE